MVDDGSTSRRLTSITYEIAWNVKNDTPTGSAIVSSGKGSENGPSARSQLSTKNAEYLKTPSSPRSNTTATPRIHDRPRSDAVRAISFAAAWLPSVTAPSSRQNFQLA